MMIPMLGSLRLRSGHVRLILAMMGVFALSILFAPLAMAGGGSSAVECSGTIAVGDVVDANVIVPNGADCTIEGTVNGNVFIASDGLLRLFGTVNGNIESQSNRGDSFTGWPNAHN